MYTIYQFLLTILFFTLLPFLLLFVLITGKHRQGLSQRFALYSKLPQKVGKTRFWLHAASVGEVQAAGVLIRELQREVPGAEFVITTMTLHGREFARKQHGDEAVCLLAPLDVPGIVHLAVNRISPDVYICLETELWPVLLRMLHSSGVVSVLVNGRMSRSSSRFYKKYARFFKGVVENFDVLCLISEDDRKRYLALGLDERDITVTGNLKYDKVLPANPGLTRERYLEMLQIVPTDEVLITGSTHNGEEEQLIPVFQEASKVKPLLWLVAPRHLDRIGSIRRLLSEKGIGYAMLSELASGDVRDSQVVVIDSFGELADLYSIGTYIFCGGSLVDERGHNLLEAAIWNKAVVHGPSMNDFQDAVDLLDPAKGAFLVKSAEEFTDLIDWFRQNSSAYRQACEKAGEIARSQQGAAQKQTGVILSLLGLKGS